MWHLGGVALMSIHWNGNNSVIFAPRSSESYVVVDIDVRDNLGKISKELYTFKSLQIKHLLGYWKFSIDVNIIFYEQGNK